MINLIKVVAVVVAHMCCTKCSLSLGITTATRTSTQQCPHDDGRWRDGRHDMRMLPDGNNVKTTEDEGSVV
jgi:hypothetical protein